ncbi:MAG: MOSC domain-containing protein [Anaerolineae bacterium]|jgi:MOSC domain-containing protein YiiM
MRILSVNVGRPREHEWRGERYTTSVFKSPVAGRVGLRPNNLEGDAQANLEVHGGEEKAVYAYPVEMYPWWCARLGVGHLPWGALGENLTVAGGDDADVYIGDVYRIGTAEVRVTKPRLPCRMLALRLDCEHAERLFLESGRSGYYMAVARPGRLGAGDEAVLLHREPSAEAVAEVFRQRTDAAGDPRE